MRIANVPVLAPLVVGLNVMLSAQLNPGFNVEPQVLLLRTKPAPADCVVIAGETVKLRTP